MGRLICPVCGCEMELNAAEEIAVCESSSCGATFEVKWYDAYGGYLVEEDCRLDDGYCDDEIDIPECCRACGGPYPDCMTSCKMFDD